MIFPSGSPCVSLPVFPSQHFPPSASFHSFLPVLPSLGSLQRFHPKGSWLPPSVPLPEVLFMASFRASPNVSYQWLPPAVPSSGSSQWSEGAPRGVWDARGVRGGGREWGVRGKSWGVWGERWGRGEKREGGESGSSGPPDDSGTAGRGEAGGGRSWDFRGDLGSDVICFLRASRGVRGQGVLGCLGVPPGRTRGCEEPPPFCHWARFLHSDGFSFLGEPECVSRAGGRRLEPFRGGFGEVGVAFP